MRTMSILAAALMALVAPAAAQHSQTPPEWLRPHAPFRIVDNVYYVGTEGLSAFLITDTKGHVLIDGGLPENAAQIAANVRTLGFDPKQIRHLLINHAHFDHAGGLAALKRMSGATLIASGADRPSLEAGRTLGRSELRAFPAVKVDRTIKDGEQVTLGGTTLTAHLTPGHTKGCTSWTMRTGQQAVLFACSLTVAGQELASNPTYPNAAADFRASFAKLRRLKADVFLNFHPEAFAMKEKRTRQAAGDANAFVDPGELSRQIDRAEKAFQTELDRQSVTR